MCQVSVILPVYNAEGTLDRCLDSLLAQTFRDFEVWLINDGSTDASQALCQSYCQRDGRFHLITQENKGPSAARNAGLDRAAGRYLYFVDADDYLEKEALFQLVTAADQSGADVTVCGFYHEKEGIRTPHVFAYPPGLYEGDACRKIALDLVGNHSFAFIPPYSVIRMIRRQVLEERGLRFTESIRRSEDYLFTTELHFLIDSLCLITDQALYHYVDNASSITNRYVRGYWDMVREIYEILSDRLPPSSQVERGLKAMLVYRSLLALNNACRAGDRPTFVQETGRILHDRLLFEAVDSLAWSDGFKRFGPYHPLMRLRLRGLVRLRYRFRHRRLGLSAER